MTLLLVRNAMPGPTIFAKPGKDTISWGPAGTPTDTRQVPDTLLEDADFLESVAAGTLVMEEAGPEADRRMEEFAAWRRSQRTSSDQALAGVLDRRQDRQISAEHCVGPGPNGRTTGCTSDVQRPAGERTQTPPLCPQHADLINEYVYDPTGSKADDADPLTSNWVRINFG